jgi:glutathione peroxidase
MITPMKKFLNFAVLLAVFTACSEQPQTNENTVVAATSTELLNEQTMSFYDFKFKNLDGQPFDFGSLKGKRVMIVNTASECGYTPQYKQLQELYSQMGGEKFTIIGFPANNFGGQEPGSNAEIASFCQKNYGVSFPMMEKISVKGSDVDPLYQWLTSKSMNGVSDGKVKWNFHKFLVDENGKWAGEYGSSTSPLDEVILNFAQGK